MSLSVITQTRLAYLIKQIAQLERQNEQIKQKLAQENLFEPYTAFRRIDQLRVGELGLSSIVEFLEDNNISHTQQELNYLFKKLDYDKDGRISFTDFTRFVLPRQDAKLKQLATLRESYFIDVQMLLPQPVERYLGQLFHQEILNSRQLNFAQEALQNSIDFSSIECFRVLDLFGNGYTTSDQIGAFLKQQGIYLSQEELDAFVKSVAHNDDNRITYGQVYEILNLSDNLLNQSRFTEQIILQESRLYNELQRSRERVRILESQYQNEIDPSLSLLRLERIQNDLRLSRLEAQRYELQKERSEFEQRGAERLRQLNQESLERSRIISQKIEKSLIEKELQRSQERILQIQENSRIRQLTTEKELLMRALDRESRLRQLELERQFIDHQIRMSSIERLSSIERQRRLDELQYSKYNPPIYSNSNFASRFESKQRTPLLKQNQQNVQESQPVVAYENFETPERVQQQQSEDENQPTGEKISPEQRIQIDVQLSQEVNEKGNSKESVQSEQLQESGEIQEN